MNLKRVTKILNQHKDELAKFGVQALALFGSVAKSKEIDGSDVDILIDFDAKQGIFVFIDLKNYLEFLLKCEVDLVTRSALHPALRKKILQEAHRVF